MNIEYYYGPDKSRINIWDEYPHTFDGRIPFHGIIPRGFLQAMESQDHPAGLWQKYACLLSGPDTGTKKDDFTNFEEVTEKCQVLSWMGSVIAVETYLEKTIAHTVDTSYQAEAWNIKEGHTSSVWRIEVTRGADRDVFALNVARDHESGLELKKTMGQLKFIQKAHPDLPVARVQDIRSVTHADLPGETVVSRNEWISNAFEIHQRQNRQTKKNEYLMVERFLTDCDHPAHITSVRGRIFSVPEAQHIARFQKKFIKLAVSLLAEPVTLNINDGDLVWCKNQAMAVALS